jgi:hypothetical protein
LRRTTLILALLGGLAVVTPVAAHPRAPDARAQPPKDGCQRSPFALVPGLTPEWVYVYNTPSTRPLPAPRWVSGVVNAYDPKYAAAHPSGDDLPSGHTAYDVNVDIKPASRYRYLLGGSPALHTGNYSGDDEETARLHTEWEDLTLPLFAWPQSGDVVRQRGSWVWDCGHWGTSVSVFDPTYEARCGGGKLGSPSCPFTGEATEFHPFRVLWDRRAHSPHSPYGEHQADLFISTDQTPAGEIADCAHEHPPPPGNSQSYGPPYQACLRSAHNWQDVSGHYSFFLPAPARPGPRSVLRYRMVRHMSIGAPPKPKIIAERGGLRILLDLHSRPFKRLALGYTFYVGWSNVSAARLPIHLRVRLDQLVVHRAMDPGCTVGTPIPACSGESTNSDQRTAAPGEWNLYVDVNGIWRSWAPYPREFDATDGKVFPGRQTIDLYVAPSQSWTLYAQGRECDLGQLGPMRDCPRDKELATGGDVPGQIVDRYRNAASSLGTHSSNAGTAGHDPTSTCPPSNAHGCYTLTYTVTVVHDRSRRADVVATPAPRGPRRPPQSRAPKRTRGFTG